MIELLANMFVKCLVEDGARKGDLGNPLELGVELAKCLREKG